MIDLGDAGECRLDGLPARSGCFHVQSAPVRLMPEYLRSIDLKAGTETRVDLFAQGPAWDSEELGTADGACRCGRVRWSDGRPAPDVWVRLFFEGFFDTYTLAWQPTGAAGEFRFSGLPDHDGAVCVEAEADGGGMARRPRAIEIVPGTVLNGVDISLDAPCRLTGTVRDARGRPCHGVAVASAYLVDGTCYTLDDRTIASSTGGFTLDRVHAAPTRI